MRKYRILFLLIFSLVCSTAFAHNLDIPPHAKWGKVAMEITKKSYPKAEIIDYQHIGRDVIDAKRSRETFKLWLRQSNKEWPVWVIITFDSKTERVQTIQVGERHSSYN